MMESVKVKDKTWPEALIFWIQRQCHIALSLRPVRHVLWVSDGLPAPRLGQGVCLHQLQLSSNLEAPDSVAWHSEQTWPIDSEGYDWVFVWLDAHQLAHSDLNVNQLMRAVKPGGRLLWMGWRRWGSVAWLRLLGRGPIELQGQCVQSMGKVRRSLRVNRWQKVWHRSYLFGGLDAGSPVGPDRYWREFFGRFLWPWAGNVFSQVWQKPDAVVPIDPATACEG